ncbi:MAG: class I SAM-dependent methyltransferase [bacterium]
MKSSRVEAFQFFGLIANLESPEFRRLEVTASTPGLKDAIVEPLHGEDSGMVFRLAKRAEAEAQALDAAGVVSAISEFFQHGYDQAVCEQRTQSITYSRTPGGVKIKTDPNTEKATGKNDFRIEVDDLIASPTTRAMLVELDVLTKKGEIRREQYNKLIQIKNLLSVVYDLLPHFRQKERLNIFDAACGKSYLSFVLYHFIREVWKLNAYFRGIDTNSRLINKCRQIQETMGYRDMEFIVSSVDRFQDKGDVDLLYSLHGCDTASDEAIAAGVRLGSYSMIVIPCCHFELRGQLRHHPLRAITKFGLFEERIAALLTDSLRALALEAAGYEVTVFRLVTDDISPKNTLLRAVKRQTPKPQARQQYQELRNMFGVSPAIEKLLPSVFTGG